MKFRVTGELRFTVEADTEQEARVAAVRALAVAEVEISASETSGTFVESQGSDITCFTKEEDA